MSTTGSTMDLFGSAAGIASTSSMPLAHRMRPDSLDQVLGHAAWLSPGRPIRRWIERDELPSLIFYGPPGSGKTTLARLIASTTKKAFVEISAVTSGAKDLKEISEKARFTKQTSGRATVLFVDEVHRFNRAQQDALLQAIEEGHVVLIGATTENPAYEINRALLSRARVVRLERLELGEVVRILERASIDPEKGLKGVWKWAPESLQWIAEQAEGDARRALTDLETVSFAVGSQSQPITLDQAQVALSASGLKQPRGYDRTGEERYGMASALIKSMRASDVDAAMYYLARMLEEGEDPLFIARRLVIFASEDIGNADQRALLVAVAARDAIDFVGMPEGRINLAHAVSCLALAPKSRAAYNALAAARDALEKTGPLNVVREGGLPTLLKGTKFYKP